MVRPISRADSSGQTPLLPESRKAVQVLSRGPLLPSNATNGFSRHSPQSCNFTGDPKTPHPLKLACEALKQVQELFPLDPEEVQAFIDACVGER